MIIGVDVDGVLTKLGEFQLTYGEKYFNKKPINPLGYKLWEEFDITMDEYKDFWLNNIFTYASLPYMREGAALAVQKLREQGHKIYMITARTFAGDDSSLGEKMRKCMDDWFKLNNFYYDKIIYSGEDKRQYIKSLKVDIMVEDSPVNIKEQCEIIPVICIDEFYNKELSGNNIIRCYNWDEVYKTIIDFANKKQ